MSTSRVGAGGIPKTLAIGTTSSCGKQAASTRSSSAFYGFGTASRDNMAKRFISDEHVSKEAPLYTPAPGAYKHQVSTGKRAPSSSIKPVRVSSITLAL